MSEPTNVTEILRVLGMANLLSKFSPRMGDTTEPLWSLLSTKNAWIWTEKHCNAFRILKEELSSSRVLALYHPDRETIVSTDASS
jgi:hypothetical protein